MISGLRLMLNEVFHAVEEDKAKQFDSYIE